MSETKIQLLKEREVVAFLSGDKSLSDALGCQIDMLNCLPDGDSVKEAKGCFPEEDFMQAFIDKAYQMSKSRVTKEDMKVFAEMLEQLQTEINQQSEYGVECLNKATKQMI